jgi:hypothetical protein
MAKGALRYISGFEAGRLKTPTPCASYPLPPARLAFQARRCPAAVLLLLLLLLRRCAPKLRLRLLLVLLVRKRLWARALSLAMVFWRRRSLCACSAALQLLRMSWKSDRGWKRPHCWQNLHHQAAAGAAGAAVDDICQYNSNFTRYWGLLQGWRWAQQDNTGWRAIISWCGSLLLPGDSFRFDAQQLTAAGMHAGACQCCNRQHIVWLRWVEAGAAT